ncbi:uncharacterized protein LOC144350101 [Saccoglossus kowalevskii]
MATQYTDHTIAAKFVTPLIRLRQLYQTLEPQLPILATNFLVILPSMLGLFEDVVSSTNNEERITQHWANADVAKLLRALSHKIRVLGRLLYSIGTNDTNMLGFTLTDNIQQLQGCMAELEQIRKELCQLVLAESITSSMQEGAIEKDDARAVWGICFGRNNKVNIQEFHRKVNEILGEELQCSPDDLKLFFKDDAVTVESFVTMAAILNANHVNISTSGLVGPAKSISDFIRLQIRLGHLRDGVVRERISPGASSAISRSSQSSHGEGKELTSGKILAEDIGRHKSWIKPKIEKLFGEISAIYRLFYGDITASEAERILDGKQAGSYILRFASPNRSRLCISVVHSVPIRDKGSWKEMVWRRNVIAHHDIIATSEGSTPHRKDDINVSERTGLCHRRNLNRHQAYRELELLLESCDEIDGYLTWL